MENCHICKRSFKNLNSLSKHISFSHPDITRQEYYDHFIKVASPICKCGELKKFRDLGVGYLEFCSTSCAEVYRPAKPWLGKTQPASLVKKRVSNTDQQARESSRRDTMTSRYGTTNPLLAPGAQKKAQQTSLENWGTLHPMQSELVLDRRKRSNRHLWKEVLIDDQLFRVQGYEDLFLRDLSKFSLTSSDLSTPPVISYDDNGTSRTYHPDFFVPERKLVIEIKSSWTLLKHKENLMLKIDATNRAGLNMWVVEYPSRKREHRLHEHLLS